MLNTLFLLTGLVGAIGLGGISLNENVNNDNQIRLVNHKSVVLDDSDFSVVYDLSDFTKEWVIDMSTKLFTNGYFTTGGSTNRLSIGGTCSHDDLNITLTGVYSNDLENDTSKYVVYFYPANSLRVTYTVSEDSVSFSYFTNGVNNDIESFDLTVIGETYYGYELDIQANQPSPGVAGVMVQFVDILVSGIVSLGSGVANGIVAMATALFLQVDNGAVTGLSVFGGIVAIFAGLALAVGITTKVYQWVTSLGN